MRVTTNTDDPQYDVCLHLCKAVTLDGVDVINRCTMADDELGEVELSKLNECGDIYVVDDKIATEIKHGKVVITL